MIGQKIKDESSSSKGKQIERPSEQEDKKPNIISLKPQTTQNTEYRFPLLIPKEIQIHYVEQQNSIMRELFNLSKTRDRYVDFSGIYLRINYLQDSSY